MLLFLYSDARDIFENTTPKKHKDECQIKSSLNFHEYENAKRDLTSKHSDVKNIDIWTNLNYPFLNS